MNIGTKFEIELAARLGLKKVPGSGNQWWDKLDIRGKNTRWSLKATGERGFRVNSQMTEEAIEETYRTGETPIWAVRTADADFIIMIADDWIALMKEDSFSIPQTKAEERRARAKVPQLLREENED